jgi:hypothetical protein
MMKKCAKSYTIYKILSIAVHELFWIPAAKFTVCVKLYVIGRDFYRLFWLMFNLLGAA